ncbi:RNA-binding protein 42 [Perkinsus olseni]|uniref:RNA-binding protein 42 n=1 Tax=Perkinsus olseni TaxID=32597 RepID=A0A7J6PK45_PEROL|nr:RNA-binding protein 42 [Perkinsus olseni]
MSHHGVPPPPPPGRNDQVADINLFMIVDGKDDLPLYSADLSSSAGRRDDSPHLDQFVMHSSLDVIDEAMWGTTDTFFPMVDRFNDFLISAFLGASNVRFLLLHRHTSIRSPQQLEQDTQNIRTFFQEVKRHTHQQARSTLAGSPTFRKSPNEPPVRVEMDGWPSSAV